MPGMKSSVMVRVTILALKLLGLMLPPDYVPLIEAVATALEVAYEARDEVRAAITKLKAALTSLFSFFSRVEAHPHCCVSGFTCFALLFGP